MKIGVVCPYSPFRPGGVQMQVASQIEILQARGHDVQLITPRPQDYTGQAPEGMIFLGQSRRIRTPQHTTAEVSMITDGETVESVVAAQNFDVLHIHEPLIPILALQLLNRVNCPAVGTFHAALPDTFLAQVIAGSIGPYKRSVFKRLGVVTAVSEAATSYIKDDVDLDKVTFIPNGIEVEAFAEEAVREPLAVLYVGRLEKRKGVRYLLSAFAQVQAALPEAQLWIAGDGPERAMLTARAKQLKLRQVKFLGAVPDSEKRRLLARCGLFVSPALYGESFGVVLLEAMAAGAPVVAGDNSGYQSVLTGTGRISLVDPRLRGEMARRMVLMLTDEPLRRAWRDWAAAEIGKYDFGPIVDSYERLYRQLTPVR